MVTTLTLDMKCPDDLKSFQAELASEIAKINDKVVIQGVACGSVIITLVGDSEEVQTVSTYIVDTGLNLPSYGKIGGKPETTEKPTESSNLSIYNLTHSTVKSFK